VVELVVKVEIILLLLGLQVVLAEVLVRVLR
jgi:hypothetical protein